MRFGRALGSPALFAIVWTSLASAIYFSLGIVAENALGLTPVVFLGAGVFFVLTAMTYVEGSSLHPDRAGATVFARYAFNELWSFIAGWAILLDFLILIAVTAFVATNYMAAFWAPLGQRCSGARDRRRHHRLRRGAQHLRDRACRAPRAGGRAGGGGHRAAAADHPRGRGARRRRRRADRDDRPRHGADVEELHLRADGQHDRLHVPGVGGGPRWRGAGRPARAAPPRRVGGGVGHRHLRRDLARRRRVAADHSRRQPADG